MTREILKQTIYLILVTLVSGVVTTGWAQDEQIVTGINLVSVNVIVTDRSGKYVKGLKGAQFEILDENVKQQIAHFSDEAAPVSLGIVCEVHNSTPAKTRAMLTALKQFTRGLGNDDDFFFMAFGSQGSVASDFVPTANQVLEHLASVKPGGPASLYDAIYIGADRLRKGRNLKKVLLIISDGEDENSRTSFKGLRNRLRDFDVQIYAIGIADPSLNQQSSLGAWVYEDLTRPTGRRPFLPNTETARGRAVLAEMTRVSGGATYYPQSENEPELVGIFAQISVELRNQYTIGFYPTEKGSRKEWHKITVRMNAEDSRQLVLSYRQSYRQVGR
jgi:Ca-activated chloride channel homolog